MQSVDHGMPWTMPHTQGNSCHKRAAEASNTNCEVLRSEECVINKHRAVLHLYNDDLLVIFFYIESVVYMYKSKYVVKVVEFKQISVQQMQLIINH